MPKIEVNERVFFDLLGQRPDASSFERILTTAKAELDEWDQSLPDDGERTIKIELNDTNRPDLWTTAGLARQLKVHRTGTIPAYPFYSHESHTESAKHTVLVQESVRQVRPWLAGFVATGMEMTDPLLRDLIQTQEKLAWNFGRKRRTVSIGIYRSSEIEWPVTYRGVDPDVKSFIPLQETRMMTLNQILAEHPKGKEYASILQGQALHPILEDSRGDVLSYPPIINSAGLGAVKIGDKELFIEVTGPDMPSVCLAASIFACDLSDMGYTIEPVLVEYEYDTPFGKNVVFPYYFQKPVTIAASHVSALLGRPFTPEMIKSAIERIGSRSFITEQTVTVSPAEYRNDFLHPVDIIEDVMISEGMDSFIPERPRDFTIGRLTPIELFTRRSKRLLVGLGFQEMIYNYLGSGKDYAERMRIDPEMLVRVKNPMSENFEFVRNSPLPGLLATESISSKAAYPHRTFEAGKVVVKDASENYGVATLQVLGFLCSHQVASFNEASGTLATLMYYLDRDYQLEISEDSRFISGRQAGILCKEKIIGIIGELHPSVLEAWGITMPTTACELVLDSILD